jgi:excisionase family DNA binding protein
MRTTHDTARYLTPPEVAERLGVSPERIIGWIRSGKLRAVNIGDGSRRPRFRISPDRLGDFLRSREVIPPAEPAPRQRRRASKWY